MKTVSLIILMLYLLQPLVCFTHPCDSCLGNHDTADTSETSGNPSHSQDADSCSSTVCCAAYTIQNFETMVVYVPLVSAIVTSERHHELPTVVIPIFVPPQSFV